MISKSQIADEARLFAESVVDAWFAAGASDILPAPAPPYPRIEPGSETKLAYPERHALRKGIPGQVYH